VPFSYDENGNLRTQPGRAYDYTTDNALESAAVDGVVTSYRYDADGWRIARRTGPVTTYALRGPANELLTEWTNPGPTGSARDYIYAGAPRGVGLGRRCERQLANRGAHPSVEGRQW
jgi:YD repeat-containing protein